jgi:putative transposase
MPNYRRARVPGGTFFFTVALEQRGTSLLIDRIDTLRAAFARTMQAAPVICDAIVVLPDHLHAVWTLPPGDSDFPERWRRIKYHVSRALDAADRPATLSHSRRAKRETGIWQRRYWEHAIRSQADFQTHVAFCWSNPVRHGLVARPADWPYSSIHRDIREGRITPDWSCGRIDGAFRGTRNPPPRGAAVGWASFAHPL